MSPSRVTGIVVRLGATTRAATAVVVGERFGVGVKVAVAHAIATSFEYKRSTPPLRPHQLL